MNYYNFLSQVLENAQHTTWSKKMRESITSVTQNQNNSSQDQPKKSLAEKSKQGPGQFTERYLRPTISLIKSSWLCYSGNLCPLNLIRQQLWKLHFCLVVSYFFQLPFKLKWSMHIPCKAYIVWPTTRVYLHCFPSSRVTKFPWGTLLYFWID